MSGIGIMECGVLVVGLGFGVLLTAFWIWMLIECATKEPDQGNDKLIWILIIVLTGFIGAAIYYFVRRPTRVRQFGV